MKEKMCDCKCPKTSRKEREEISWNEYALKQDIEDSKNRIKKEQKALEYLEERLKKIKDGK